MRTSYDMIGKLRCLYSTRSGSRLYVDYNGRDEKDPMPRPELSILIRVLERAVCIAVPLQCAACSIWTAFAILDDLANLIQA